MHDTIGNNIPALSTNEYTFGDIPVSRRNLNEFHVLFPTIFEEIHTTVINLESNHKKIDTSIMNYNKLVNYENEFIGKWVENMHKDKLVESESLRTSHLQDIKRIKMENTRLEIFLEDRKLLKVILLEQMQKQVDKNDWNLGRGKLHINNEDQSVELEVDGIRTKIKPETKKSLYENIANDLNIEILNYNKKYSDLIKEKNKSTRVTTKVIKTYKGRTTTEISKDIEELLKVIKKTNDKIRLNRSDLGDFNTK